MSIQKYTRNSNYKKKENSLTSMASYMHALVLASLKTWNPKESAGRETVSLASCSTGSSSGREVLSTSCSRWLFRVTCLGERVWEGKKKVERQSKPSMGIAATLLHVYGRCMWFTDHCDFIAGDIQRPHLSVTSA